MDIRGIAWAGYELKFEEAAEEVIIVLAEPDVTTEDVGNMHVSSRDVTDVSMLTRELKPKMMAEPNPTQ